MQRVQLNLCFFEEKICIVYKFVESGKLIIRRKSMSTENLFLAIESLIDISAMNSSECFMENRKY